MHPRIAGSGKQRAAVYGAAGAWVETAAYFVDVPLSNIEVR